jgi:hypothetical protein
MKLDLGWRAYLRIVGITDDRRAARDRGAELPLPQPAAPAKTSKFQGRWAPKSILYLQSFT